MTTVTINSRKFDGQIHRSWECKLVEETSDHWLFVGEFETELTHSKLGLIRQGTISYEYYLKNKWYNVFRFQEPEGNLKYYYCNLNMPPTFQNQVLDYVDLDVDVIVKENFSYEILDLDEFEVNSKLFNYPAVILDKVQETLVNLLEMIDRRNFPFDCKTQ
jgi:protein associated with RNAse G/E